MNDIVMLRQIWEDFFDKIRDRTFDAAAADSVIQKISQIDCEKPVLDKELVSLLWISPLFMEWNRERCVENGTDLTQYKSFSDKLTELVIQKLGTPS